MSAVPKIIEGTWEEVSKRAKELEGHRLRVIVLDEVSAQRIRGLIIRRRQWRHGWSVFGNGRMIGLPCHMQMTVETRFTRTS